MASAQFIADYVPHASHADPGLDPVIANGDGHNGSPTVSSHIAAGFRFIPRPSKATMGRPAADKGSYELKRSKSGLQVC